MRRATLTRPMLLAAAAFTAAGGYVHAREWFDGYRDVPAGAPGAWLVRIGFPVNAGLSLLLAAALVVAATRRPRFAGPTAIATFAFQAGSLGLVIGTRVGTVFGWTEPIWTRGADQSRAVEIGALVALAAAGSLHLLAPRLQRAPTARRAG